MSSIFGLWRQPAAIPGATAANSAVSLETVYAVVAARRLQWDNLLWQVPILGLTAQAFLFTIQLGGDSRQVSRVIAALLSLVVTYLCVTLMARHRQAELFDAHWLEAFEKEHWPQIEAVHGYSFAARRNAEPVDGGWTDSIVPLVRGYRTWIGGLLFVGAAALVNLVLAVAAPQVMASWGK